ncbi:unnamed protein product [Caenorhabditis angaria]|uniref:Uncharacterized protein n=1 Tax=Caenorhabditis angaria TaxID=860376 RepID=A0A9P1MTX4_9PELO|nr:unnamed protein product [Caenorhabditis angaria]
MPSLSCRRHTTCALFMIVRDEYKCTQNETGFEIVDYGILIKAIPEFIFLTITFIFTILTFIVIRQNRHILSETKRKAELSIIYQNTPILIAFIYKYIGALVIYFIRNEGSYDDRDDYFRMVVCSVFIRVESIFPVVYTAANFARFQSLFSCCACCLKCCCCCKRRNRISDNSLQFKSTTRMNNVVEN